MSKIKAPGFGAPIEPKTRKEKSCSAVPSGSGQEMSIAEMQQGGADDAAL